jgi:hypothetical protein
MMMHAYELHFVSDLLQKMASEMYCIFSTIQIRHLANVLLLPYKYLKKYIRCMGHVIA